MKRFTGSAVLLAAFLLSGCGGAGAIPSLQPDHAIHSPSSGSTGDVMTETQFRALVAAGGNISLPAGSIHVGGLVIDVPVNTTISGPGTTIYWQGLPETSPTTTHHLFRLQSGDVLENITIDGSESTSNKGMIEVEGNGVTISSAQIKNAPSFGVFVYDSENALIEHSTFSNDGRLNGADTIGGGGDTNAVYDSNAFYNCHGTSIDNVSNNGGSWTHNTVNAPTDPLITNGGSGSMLSDNDLHGVTIAYNTLNAGSIGLNDTCGVGCPTPPAPTNNIIHDNVLWGANALISVASQGSNNQVYHNEIDGVWH